MPSVVVGQTGLGMRQVVGFGDRPMGKGYLVNFKIEWWVYEMLAYMYHRLRQ